MGIFPSFGIAKIINISVFANMLISSKLCK